MKYLKIPVIGKAPMMEENGVQSLSYKLSDYPKDGIYIDDITMGNLKQYVYVNHETGALFMIMDSDVIEIVDEEDSDSKSKPVKDEPNQLRQESSISHQEILNIIAVTLNPQIALEREKFKNNNK